MKEILEYIDKKNKEFSCCQLFGWLRDESVTSEDRLCFAPYMAHFVFSFMDINRFVLRDLSSDNELQKLINIHTDEDSHHWPWYLNDIKEMQFDKNCNFSDTLYFLWGDHTIKSRMLTYDMIGLIKQATVKEKVMIVEVIEKTGNVFLSHTAEVCKGLNLEHKSLYYGKHHLDCETGHHMGTEGIESLLSNIPLSDSEGEQGKCLVDDLFQLYHNFVDEMYDFASSHDYQSLVAAEKYLSNIKK